MKRLLIVVIVFIMLICGCIYFFIPSTIIISDFTVLAATKGSAYRFISDEDYWKKWWPDYSAPKDAEQPQFFYNGFTYQVDERYFNNVNVATQGAQFNINSSIRIIPFAKDSVIVQWKYQVKSSLNPVKRFRQYQHAKALKNSTSELLSSLDSYMQDEGNVYGIPITKLVVTDSFLITATREFQHYPKTTDVYEVINDLKNYANEYDALLTNYPMLNIRKTDSNRFKMMIGLPINREIKGKNDIVFKHFILGGNLITAKVRGGTQVIQSALTQLENYIHDHQLVPLAIPYQLLITDRSNIADSSKWITQVCYPILN